IAHDGTRPRRIAISPGWHVLTHTDLDDLNEPRTAWLLDRLARQRPETWAAAETLVKDLVRPHGGDGAPPGGLHQGIMVTVSASVVEIDDRGIRYLDGEGRPCAHEYQDESALLIRASAGDRA